jgi:hypothetical protein
MKKIKKIEKININLMDDTEEDYNKAKNKYISEYEEYEPSFFFGGYKKRPDVGEAKWNFTYPNGFASWRSWQSNLSGYGEQQLIDKINEIIELLNSKTS